MTVVEQRKTRAQPARARNLALLVLSYGLGQGSTFLVQTWLVATGQLSVLAAFGTHMSYALLCVTVVDAGATTILARHAAQASEPSHAETDLWQIYWNVTFIRLCVSAVIASVAACSLLFIEADRFTIDYVIFALPALLIWSFNFTGILDGLRLSGFNGIANALPFILSAAALVFSLIFGAEYTAFATGLALTVGILLAVALQYAVLLKYGHRVNAHKPNLKEAARAVKNHASLLGAILPGQLYFRLQIHLCNVYLGADATAIFIYVKQILVAVAQVIGFIRRVEFPELVVKLRSLKDGSIRAIVISQKLGTIASIVFSLLLVLAAVIILLLDAGEFTSSASLILVFAPCLVTNALALAFQQGLAALGRFHAMFAVTVMSVLVGASVAFALVDIWGVSGLLVGDILVDLTAIGLIIFTLIQRKIRVPT